MLSITAGSSAAPQRRRGSAPRGTAADGGRVAGQPPPNYVIPATSYFSFPNRSAGLTKLAIRNRVLATINSTWGGPQDRRPAWPGSGNGTIRIATWTFKDRAVARALVSARNRGVSVQVVAAKSANEGDPRLALPEEGSSAAGSASPATPRPRDKVSFARECRGSCRGRGGTAHAKYFLFTNVGQLPRAHHRDPDLDEPDPDGLPGPVEPGRGDAPPGRSTSSS